MNCEDFLLMLDEYVENELDEKSAAQVPAHLAVCETCADYYEKLEREQKIYSQYLLRVEATPALWVNVQAEIDKIQRERFSLGTLRDWFAKISGIRSLNSALAATSLVLLFAFAAVISLIKYKSAENAFNVETISQKTDINQAQSSPEKSFIDAKDETSETSEKHNTSGQKVKNFIANAENKVKKNKSSSNSLKPTKQFINSKSVNPNRNPATDEVVEKAELQYKNAIAILSRDIRRRQTQLSPNLISQYKQSLADIDQTINETRRAVQAQPTDPVAIQYMTTAYAKKIELLRTIAGN